MMSQRVGWVLVFLSLWFCSAVWGLTDAELIAVRDGFDGRRDAMLDLQVSSPYPNYTPGDTHMFVWNRLDFALAALYRNTQLSQANTAIIDACNELQNDPVVYDEQFHWEANLFYRIYRFFSHDSSYWPGRLTPQAEAAIYDIFWTYAKRRALIADADYSISRTWYPWGSENHDAMDKTTFWSAAEILKDVAPYNGYSYDDGSTVPQQYAAWTAFFKEYLRERAKKGLLVEIATHTYTKYTLQGWYNFCDFAEDQELRKLAEMTLDVWWADWALDQINGVRGGGKSRIYHDADELATKDGAYSMCWYYLGFGQARDKHPGQMCLATSMYRLPLVVMDLALDIEGRGTYEFRSRRPGLNVLPRPAGLDSAYNALDPNGGAMQRYTYVTPDYVLGTCMVENRPETDWANISDQNRWHGLILAKHINARIFPQCVGLPVGYDKTYNESWSVQNKWTMIAQKLTGSSHTGDMRVFFSSDYFDTYEEGDWILVDAEEVYAAVRPAYGGYMRDNADWITCFLEYAPVIIEVARSGEYGGSFEAFKADVLDQVISHSNGVLTYEGLRGSGTFTFYTQSTQFPEIDGVPVDYEPGYTFQSPYLNEDWASGVVTINKDQRQRVLDFNQVIGGSCGDWGYFETDLNHDCYVNHLDVDAMAADWLGDKTDPDSGSDDYPNLAQENWPLPGNYNVPRAQAIPTIDGTVSVGEWIDARTVEMVYPTLVTPPNTGGLQTGTTAPSNAADFSLYWFLKWDPDNLYLLGVVYDDIIVTDNGKDAPVLCLNFLNNPAATFPSQLFLWVLDTDGTITPFFTPGPTNSTLVGSVHADHYVLEMRIPWSDIAFGQQYSASVNDVHGFALACQDHENSTDSAAHYFIDSGSGSFNGTVVSTYNTLTLVEDMPLGEAGSFDADFSADYRVDLNDFATMSNSWGDCSYLLDGSCNSAN